MKSKTFKKCHLTCWYRIYIEVTFSRDSPMPRYACNTQHTRLWMIPSSSLSKISWLWKHKVIQLCAENKPNTTPLKKGNGYKIKVSLLLYSTICETIPVTSFFAAVSLFVCFYFQKPNWSCMHNNTFVNVYFHIAQMKRQNVPGCGSMWNWFNRKIGLNLIPAGLLIIYKHFTSTIWFS